MYAIAVRHSGVHEPGELPHCPIEEMEADEVVRGLESYAVRMESRHDLSDIPPILPIDGVPLPEGLSHFFQYQVRSEFHGYA